MSDQFVQKYPWYDYVESDDELEQGDFIDSCKILIPRYTFPDVASVATSTTTSEYQTEVDADTYDVVILNQTCDLQSKTPLPYVLVCPRWPYTKVEEKYPNFASKENFEQVRKGKQYRYCMLNKCDLPDLLCDIQVVDLGKVFSIPTDIMKQIAKSKEKRIRLLSPYKEKLAQAFAYYYMRVALPNDIEEYDIVKQAQVSTRLGH